MWRQHLGLYIASAIAILAVAASLWLLNQTQGDAAAERRLAEQNAGYTPPPIPSAEGVAEDVGPTRTDTLSDAPQLDPYNSDPTEEGLRRAAIALEEYQNFTMDRIDTYTLKVRDTSWCTFFVSWVANEAGTPVREPQWSVGNSRVLSEILTESGTYFSRDEVLAQGIEPRPGDFIIYSRGSFNERLGHADIVLSVTGDGRADLVGKNGKALGLKADYPYREHAGFLGIGRPE